MTRQRSLDKNPTSDFRKSSIDPFSADNFSEEDFLESEVTDIPRDETNTVQQTCDDPTKVTSTRPTEPQEDETQSALVPK